VEKACKEITPKFEFLYPLDLPIAEKIGIIAKEVYKAASVEFSPEAVRKCAEATRRGAKALPPCSLDSGHNRQLPKEGDLGELHQISSLCQILVTSRQVVGTTNLLSLSDQKEL